MPRAHLKELLHQEPRVKIKDLFRINSCVGKMPTFLENFRRKNFVLVFLSLSLYVNQHNNEPRWLVSVGMFSQNECLL